nr:hypothetical protein [Tanacetum cinerariifolium]
ASIASTNCSVWPPLRAGKPPHQKNRDSVFAAHRAAATSAGAAVGVLPGAARPAHLRDGHAHPAQRAYPQKARRANPRRVPGPERA